MGTVVSMVKEVTFQQNGEGKDWLLERSKGPQTEEAGENQQSPSVACEHVVTVTTPCQEPVVWGTGWGWAGPGDKGIELCVTPRLSGITSKPCLPL